MYSSRTTIKKKKNILKLNITNSRVLTIQKTVWIDTVILLNNCSNYYTLKIEQRVLKTIRNYILQITVCGSIE